MPTHEVPPRGRPLSTSVSAEPQRSSYLDDPGHVFELEHSSHGARGEDVLADLLRRRPAPEDLAVIVSGAATLFEQFAGTAAECLDTSMTWLYG